MTNYEEAEAIITMPFFELLKLHIIEQRRCIDEDDWFITLLVLSKREIEMTEFIKAFDVCNSILEQLGSPAKLEIKQRHDWDDKDSLYYASISGVEVKEGQILSSVHGNGAKPSKALIDYYDRIVGKTIVYHAMGDDRTTLFVEGDWNVNKRIHNKTS